MAVLDEVRHNFEEDLAFSHSDLARDFWSRVYQEVFPSATACIVNQNNKRAQFAGADCTLHFINGSRVHIEEKLQRRHFDSLCLEFLSDANNMTPGWIERDLACDFVAYGFLASGAFHVIPWPLLQRAWKKYGERWKRFAHENQHGFRIVKCTNDTGKVTLSVGIPWVSLYEALKHIMMGNIA